MFTGLQSDDWIALDEGSWFYMPTLYPAASFSQAMQVLQTQDVLIKEIPEVKDVLGKIGRVESALDPAPAAMVLPRHGVEDSSGVGPRSSCCIDAPCAGGLGVCAASCDVRLELRATGRV